MAKIRSSEPKSKPDFVEPTQEEAAHIEERNGLLQYDRLASMIEMALKSERKFRLRPSQLQELNRIAVQGLLQAPGVWRQVPVEIKGSIHEPPHHEEVPELVDEMCDYVSDHWEDENALHLASYVMWRLNWIHPFEDGNGRTSRAVSYLVLSVRTGYVLPGSTTIPERISEDKGAYYEALDAADLAWRSGEIDISVMENLVGDYLAAQLLNVFKDAGGKTPD